MHATLAPTVQLELELDPQDEPAHDTNTTIQSIRMIPGSLRGPDQSNSFRCWLQDPVVDRLAGELVAVDRVVRDAGRDNADERHDSEVRHK